MKALYIKLESLLTKEIIVNKIISFNDDTPNSEILKVANNERNRWIAVGLIPIRLLYSFREMKFSMQILEGIKEDT